MIEKSCSSTPSPGSPRRACRVEIDQRGKGAHKDRYQAFRYGDEQIFRSKLRRAGYANFETFKGDASTFDWSSIGPIGCVLIDIDLYAPTAKILDVIYPHLCEGGGIVVDDCVPDTPWDGSLQAYVEFVQVHGLPFERVGGNGAVIRRWTSRRRPERGIHPFPFDRLSPSPGYLSPPQ
jgi:O-methyltransferase